MLQVVECLSIAACAQCISNTEELFSLCSRQKFLLVHVVCQNHVGTFVQFADHLHVLNVLSFIWLQPSFHFL